MDRQISRMTGHIIIVRLAAAWAVLRANMLSSPRAADSRLAY